jgi:hypothetical protein
MRLLPIAVIVLTALGYAVFIYGDIISYRVVRLAGVSLVALAGVGLMISALRERAAARGRRRRLS